MSESSESLCKLISNILGINWAINQWYMRYFVHLAGAGLCVCVCENRPMWLKCARHVITACRHCVLYFLAPLRPTRTVALQARCAAEL